MGFYNTEEEIVFASIRKIDSLDNPRSSVSFSANEEGYFTDLRRIIASEMEQTVYPFAIVISTLTNPSIDTGLSNENSRIYTKPVNIAKPIGVFKESQVPSVISIAIDSDSLKRSSIPYSFVGDSQILVLSSDEDLKFIYTNKSPSISVMTTPFQEFLVYKLAYENYFKTGSNSRYLVQLKRDYLEYLSVAKFLSISGSFSFVNHAEDIDRILEYGQPDGGV